MLHSEPGVFAQGDEKLVRVDRSRRAIWAHAKAKGSCFSSGEHFCLSLWDCGSPGLIHGEKLINPLCAN